MSGEDDSDGASRFHCPHPGCKRTFAELWRLVSALPMQALMLGQALMGVAAAQKVHYRADPNVRGSGKERGHGCVRAQCEQLLACLRQAVRVTMVQGGAVAVPQVPRAAAAGQASRGLQECRASLRCQAPQGEPAAGLCRPCSGQCA